MKMDLRPELKVQLELDAHEKEWAKIDGNTIADAD